MPYHLTFEQTLLYQAVRNNNLSMAQRVLAESNIDINFDTSHSSRAKLIHLAVQKGSLDLVKLLLSHRPVLCASDHFGNTPLGVAAVLGRADIAEALLNAGANVNAIGTIDNPYAPSVTGITALHAAALRGDILMMSLLLSYGADINMVKIQVKRKFSDPSTSKFFKKNNISCHETALDIVERKGFEEAETFLRACGAKNASGQESAYCSMM